MATQREKQLTALLLKERLERLTGKKVMLEAKVSDKDWERMSDLVLTNKDGSGIAQTISNKDKAIARFVAGLKLKGENIRSDRKSYWGSFNEFGNRALQLGATPEEIQDTFDSTIIPPQYSNKLKTLGSKDKKLKDRFVGSLTKLVLSLGLDIKFLPTNENALTREGMDAMRRNGRKWTIGYKAEITKQDGSVVRLNFDAITDEGDGPTFYVIAPGSDIRAWGVMGKREFLTGIKNQLEKVAVPV